MTDDFIPPIKERTIDQLLDIVGDHDKWNPKAVSLANNELKARNVNPKKIETAKYLSNKRKRIEKRIKANESYDFCDFVFNPLWTLIEITFAWELKKDGFVRKARQQRYFRIGLGLLIIFCICFAYL